MHLENTIDQQPTVRRPYSASNDRLLQGEISQALASRRPPALVQRDVEAWWHGVKVSVRAVADRLTISGFGDPDWLRTVGVVPSDERSGVFQHQISSLTGLSGLRVTEFRSDWDAPQSAFGLVTHDGVQLVDLDPHPSRTVPSQVLWTAVSGEEVEGPVEWRRGLGYVSDEPVDVLWSQGDDCWVTVADTSPLAGRGRRIIDAPFDAFYRGRTAFWVARSEIGQIAPYRMMITPAGPTEILRGRYACVNGRWRPVDGSNAAVLGDDRVPLFIQTVSPLPERAGDEFVWPLRAPRGEDELVGSRVARSIASVEEQDVEIAEPYSAWNGSDVFRVFSDGRLGARADDGYDRGIIERAGRELAYVRSFEAGAVRTVLGE